jgi:hypothetical protein
VITVRISKSLLSSFGADIHVGIHTLERLRKAGIPVTGNLLPVGVGDGVLTMTNDSFTDEVIWTWDGEENMA